LTAFPARATERPGTIGPLRIRRRPDTIEAMDDPRLLDSITTGDRDAFRALVEREQVAVFRTCFRILGRAAEAEDVVQESFVIAYRAIGTYRGEGTLGAWLGRIATRQALRRLGQRRDGVSLDVAGSPIEIAGGPDPLGAALAAERERAVRGAVAALQEPYRETVAMRFFAELSLNEIAAATGRPLGTVKTHLRRGLLRMRDLLVGENAL
jgi:RNA polymerase sigma-70 factor (ECF subfamily)